MEDGTGAGISVAVMPKSMYGVPSLSKSFVTMVTLCTSCHVRLSKKAVRCRPVVVRSVTVLSGNGLQGYKHSLIFKRCKIEH